MEVDGERHEVPLAKTRASLKYSQGRWQPAVAGAGEAAEGAAAAPAAKEAEAEGQDAAQPAAKKRGKKQAQAAAAEEPQAQAAAEAAEPAGEDGEEDEPGGKRRCNSGRKQQRPMAAHAGDGAAPADADAAGAGGSTAATPSAAPAASPAKAGKKGGGGSSAKKAAAAYEVPPGFDPAVLPPADLSSARVAKNSVPLAFCRRFLALRRALPTAGECGRAPGAARIAGRHHASRRMRCSPIITDLHACCLEPSHPPADLPTYESSSSHLRGVDAQLLAQALAEVMHACVGQSGG